MFHVLEKLYSQLFQRRIVDLIKLEPRLNYLMEGLRRNRQQTERRELLDKRLLVLNVAIGNYAMKFPPNTPLPKTPDIFKLPLVLNIINSRPDDEFKAEDLNPFIELYPEIARQWKQEKEAQLLEMIRSSCGESYTFDPNTVLGLATTMFSCVSCRSYDSGPVWYPRILIHCHAKKASSMLPDPQADFDTQIMEQTTRSVAWKSRNIFSFLNNERLFLSDVLKEFGFDPETITAEEMNALDPIFECIPCNDIRRGRYTMKWTHLVRQSISLILCLILFSF